MSELKFIIDDSQTLGLLHELRDRAISIENRLSQIEVKEIQIMATIQDVDAKLDAVSTALDEIAQDEAALQADIQALKDQLAQGVQVTQAQLDALDQKALNVAAKASGRSRKRDTAAPYAVMIFWFLIGFTVTTVLTWHNNETSTDWIGTRVERSVDGGEWSHVFSVSKYVSSTTMAVDANKETCYRLKAYTLTKESEPSEIVCVTPAITTRIKAP